MQPLEKQNLHKTLVDHLVEAILSDEIPCGEKLGSEISMAEALGVSRNILREALKTLEIFGIIESRHGRGTFIAENAKQLVSNIGFAQTLARSQSVLSLLETRIVLEPGLARFAARRRTKEDLVQMRTLANAPMGADTDVLSPDFHLSIARAAKCEVLEKYLESVLSQLRFTDYYQLHRRLSLKYLEQEAHEHGDILSLIETGDEDGACRAVYAHLQGLYGLMEEL